MDVSGNIKKFREYKNVSREYMAAQLGMSHSGYSKIERGEVDLTISRIAAIAKLLDVDMAMLFYFNSSYVFDLPDNLQDVEEDEVPLMNLDAYYREKYIGLLEKEIERLRSSHASDISLSTE